MAHINPSRFAGDNAARNSENTADADGGGQSGFIINPGSPAGDGGIYVAMTAYDDAWVTTPTDGYYNAVNAPTTHGPNGNCIETVTNYYNGFTTPGTTVDLVQFYDFCANGGQGAFAGAIPMDADFVRDYVRVYADSARPLPRYISVVEYSAADKRYHNYLYNASLQQYVDFYDSPAGATTNANGSEGWSIYETHYNGGDCTALPDASEESIQVHTTTGWHLLAGSQVFSYMWGTCFSAPFNAPYNAPTFSTSPSVAWTVLSPVAPALSAYARTIVAAAPLAYYRLGDTGSAAIDSSGSKMTGAYGANVKRGAPSLLASEASNTAATFPGGSAVASNVVSIPASTKLQPSTAVSVEAWVQESVPSTGTSDIVAYGSMTSGVAYTLQVLSNNTACAFVSTAHGGYGLVTGKTALGVGRPYLLSLTYDGANLSLYFDGTLDGSSPATGALSYATPGTTNGLSIGSTGNSTRPVFAGTVDEVAVFGSSLSAATIAAHWTAGSGIAPRVEHAAIHDGRQRRCAARVLSARRSDNHRRRHRSQQDQRHVRCGGRARRFGPRYERADVHRGKLSGRDVEQHDVDHHGPQHEARAAENGLSRNVDSSERVQCVDPGSGFVRAGNVRPAVHAPAFVEWNHRDVRNGR